MVDTPADFAAELRKKAIELARRAAGHEAASPQTLRGLMELCRQQGHLEETRVLADRLVGLAPGEAGARALSDILNRRPQAAPRPPGQAGPIPIVRLMDFLTPETRAQVDLMIDEALPRFKPALVYKDDLGAAERPDDRRSLVFNATRAFADLFLPLVKQAVQDHQVIEVLGVGFPGARRYELEATCHGDGAFFKAHTDCGSLRFRPRVVSFVYYFHTRPKAFSGGDLLVFDDVASPGQPFRGAFTRVEPADNSIVFFPSAATHEVEPVAMPTGGVRDGRFTLNGWIRNAEG